MGGKHVAAGRFSNHLWLTAGIIVTAGALAATSSALIESRLTASKAGASYVSTLKGHRSLSLVSTAPSPGATGVAPDASLSLYFSSPLAVGSAQPSLNPPVAGTWIQTSPGTLAFEALGSLPPGETEQLSVPGGSSGILASNGAHLPQSVTVSFVVAPMSTLRLQQLLAQLDYLPVSFTPSDAAPISPTEMAMPQVGSFAWRWNSLPSSFMALWSPGVPNVVTEGAVMAFENQHQLPTDGAAGPQVWGALLQAAATGQIDTYGHYDFVEVATSIPEHVNVWRDGAVAYTSVANSGIEAAPTEFGTWPVYARYVSTTMSGTNPDGSHYSDPNIPWVSYFHGGDALHGFIRSSYGTPQSLGCVEMPPANAAVVYPYTPLGTLVTVS
jgi:peptidoglycan hydrolase-like protein with peptidoglycan-binding domain